MKKLNLIVEEQPVAQKRHRHHKFGVYDPSSKDKIRIKSMLLNQVRKFYTDKPVSVIIAFKIQRPKSHFRTGKYSHLLKKKVPLFPTSKSTKDLDNLVKIYLDILTLLKVWDDDSQVINLSASKQYVNDNPATEITIYKI
tara:strand:- start:181 stop:600 length:420 start_codon:yes stop_codon:yes gene_type:complete